MLQEQQTEYRQSRTVVNLNNDDSQQKYSKNTFVVQVKPVDITPPIIGDANDMEDFILPFKVSIKIEQNKENLTTQEKTLEKKRSRNIMVLLDRSESMMIENRILKAQNSLIQIAKGLDQEDCLGVISFGNSNELVLPFTQAAQCNYSYIEKRILSVQATGQTNIVAVLQKANSYIETYQNNFDPQLKKSYTLLLLSDGYDNQSKDKAMHYIRENLKNSKMNFTIHTFGYGRDHDAKLLSGIALYGGGSFSYVRDDDNIFEKLQDSCKFLDNITTENIEFTINIEKDYFMGRNVYLLQELLPSNSKILDKNSFKVYYKYLQAGKYHFFFYIMLANQHYEGMRNTDTRFTQLQKSQKLNEESVLSLFSGSHVYSGDRAFKIIKKRKFRINHLSIGTTKVQYCHIGEEPIFEFEDQILLNQNNETQLFVFDSPSDKLLVSFLEQYFSFSLKIVYEAYKSKQQSKGNELIQALENYIKQYLTDENRHLLQKMLDSIDYYRSVYQKNEKAAMNEANILLIEQITGYQNINTTNKSEKPRIRIEESETILEFSNKTKVKHTFPHQDPLEKGLKQKPSYTDYDYINWDPKLKQLQYKQYTEEEKKKQQIKEGLEAIRKATVDYNINTTNNLEKLIKRIKESETIISDNTELQNNFSHQDPLEKDLKQKPSDTYDSDQNPRVKLKKQQYEEEKEEQQINNELEAKINLQNTKQFDNQHEEVQQDSKDISLFFESEDTSTYRSAQKDKTIQAPKHSNMIDDLSYELIQSKDELSNQIPFSEQIITGLNQSNNETQIQKAEQQNTDFEILNQVSNNTKDDIVNSKKSQKKSKNINVDDIKIFD